MEGIHLASEPYKNQEKYDEFDEEKKKISKKKKIAKENLKKIKLEKKFWIYLFNKNNRYNSFIIS